VDAAELGAALVPCALTPLDASGLRLVDVAPRDRLAELEFELPLAGGDTRTGTPLDLAAVAALLRTTCPPTTRCRVRRRPRRAGGEPHRGYLTGSIDAVLRLPGGRFAVVDYKTNRLGPPARSRCAWALRVPRLVEAMRAAHYPLQALLYSAALHRYLRWRLPGYDPARHLGGVLYLFVRGMAGPDTPVVDGPRLRRLLLDAPAGAGHRPVGPARREHPVTAPAVDPGDAAWRSAPAGCSARSTRPACWTRPTCGWPSGWDAWAGRTAPRCCSPSPWPRGRCGRARCASTWPPSTARCWARATSSSTPPPCPGRSRARGSRPAGRAGWSPTARDAPGARPLRLVDGRLYLQRYWGEEELVRLALARRAADPPAVAVADVAAGLAGLFDGDPRAVQQRRAAAVAALRPGTVLAGGPGTGKTPTVAKLLTLLLDLPAPRPPRGGAGRPHREGGGAAAGGRRPRPPGAAPQPRRRRHHPAPPAGLAARRAHLPVRPRPPAAVRRRGGRRDVDGVAHPYGPGARRAAPRRPAGARGRPRPARVGGGRVPCWATSPGPRARPSPRLDAALRALGLPGGVVHGVVTLDHVWRFGGAIAELARAVRDGDGDAALAVLRRGDPALGFVELRDPVPDSPALDGLWADVVGAGRDLARTGRAGDAAGAVAALDAHRLLCAHRRGPYGVTRWAVDVERRLSRAGVGRGPRAPLVPRPGRAGHGERPRRRPLQRRHRRRPSPPTTACGSRSPAAARPASSCRRGCPRSPGCTP
jgi:hypothetical protein